MKRGKVLKPFGYSVDGLNVVDFKPGDVDEFFDAIADGLVKEGFLALEGFARDVHNENIPSVADVAPKPSETFFDVVSAPQEDAPAPIETKTGGGELHIRHLGRGKWAVYLGSERVTRDPMDKSEAECALADLLDATK